MPLMQQYNAYPDYMNKLTDRRQLLRTNPGALSNNDVVNLYAQEAYNPDKSFALPKNEALALADQMNQRNLWGARADIIKADPNRTWLPDGQMVNSRYHDEITNYANQTPPSLRTPKTGPVQTANPQADQQAPQTQPGQPQAARPQTDTQQGQPGQQAATPMPDSRGSAYAPVGETEATQPDASTPPAQNPTQSPAVDQDFSAGEQGPGQSPQAPPAPPPPTTLSNHYDPVPQANGGGFVAGQPPAAPSQTGVQVPVPPAAPQGGTPSLLDAIQAQSLGGF
jgi:hypothetical protein